MIFFNNGDVIELRALGKKKNAVQSGYFKDLDKLENTISVLDKTGEHKGIYVVLNEINPALYARSPDTLSSPRESIVTTSDADIKTRRWLPIDLDPIRPAEISSSEEEHKAALQRAVEVRDNLRLLGWPDPILADSGNGAHLVYSIELDNTEKSADIIEFVLKALDALFSDNVVEIDTKNYNAARIWKAYGTMARKGANIEDRPWRRSQILEVPSEIRPVPRELLVSMAWEYEQKENAERSEKNTQKGYIDLEQWLPSHGLDIVKQKKAHGGGTMYVLDQCPWNTEHVDRSAWAVQFLSGAIAAGCHHNGCSGKGWKELRMIYEPDTPCNEKPIPPVQPPRHVKHAIVQLQFQDVCDMDYNDKTGKPENVKFNSARAADAISQYLQIIATPSNTIWIYNDGYYKPNGEDVIDQILDNVAGKLYLIQVAKETHRKIYLRNLIQFNELDKDKDLICCRNGVINIETGEFLPHDPRYNMTRRINASFDPNAKCDAIIKFFEDITPNYTDRLMLIDWIALHAFRRSFPYVMFLLGRGRNGKGVYEDLLMRFYGEEFFSNMALDQTTRNNFATGQLFGKYGLIVSEAAEEDYKGKKKIKTNFLKLCSGDGFIDSDVKNVKDRIRFRPTFKATIDCNDMPEIDDMSIGWTERFCKADLPYLFLDNPTEPHHKLKDPNLIEKLTTDEELSGLLNLILSRTKEIAKTSTIVKRSGEVLSIEYDRQSHSMRSFLEEFCNYEAGGSFKEDINSLQVYNEYKRYCVAINGAIANDQSFGWQIRKFCDNSKSERIRDQQGNRIRIYSGFRFDKNLLDNYIITQSQCVPICPKLSQEETVYSPNVSQHLHKNTWCSISVSCSTTRVVPPLYSMSGQTLGQHNENDPILACPNVSRTGLIAIAKTVVRLDSDNEENKCAATREIVKKSVLWEDCEVCDKSTESSRLRTWKHKTVCVDCYMRVS